MDQTSGAVKPMETGVGLRLRAKVRTEKNTENSSTNVIAFTRDFFEVIIVTGGFDSAGLRV